MLFSRFLPLFAVVLMLGVPSRATDLMAAPGPVWGDKGKPKKGDGDPPRPKPAPGPREGGDDE